MSTILTLYLAGMLATLILLVVVLRGAPRDDLIEVGTSAGVVAVVIFLLLWPVFMVGAIYDAMTEGSE